MQCVVLSVPLNICNAKEVWRVQSYTEQAFQEKYSISVCVCVCVCFFRQRTSPTTRSADSVITYETYGPSPSLTWLFSLREFHGARVCKQRLKQIPKKRTTILASHGGQGFWGNREPKLVADFFRTRPVWIPRKFSCAVHY